jgi:hypothetical protein
MKKEKYAYVQYKEDYSSKLWIYKCDETFSANDIVEAPICNYSYNNIAIIKKIKFLTNKQLPVEKDKILTISTKLDKQKYEKYFHPLKCMKNYINEELLKEWHFADKNNWVKFYQSTFGGQISYEKDGVLTCSLGNCMNDDFFEEYTITGHKNLNIKLKFLKTALAELYYKIIDEKEFKELLNIV